MTPHHAHVCPSLSEFHLDVNQSVSVTANAPINRLVLIKSAGILVQDLAAETRNVEPSAIPRCAFVPMILPAIPSSNVIPDRVSFEEK